MSKPECYLGDGAYCGFDGYEFRISTTDGIVETNAIYLEPIALTQLVEYALSKGWKYRNSAIVLSGREPAQQP